MLTALTALSSSSERRSSPLRHPSKLSFVSDGRSTSGAESLASSFETGNNTPSASAVEQSAEAVTGGTFVKAEGSCKEGDSAIISVAARFAAGSLVFDILKGLRAPVPSKRAKESVYYILVSALMGLFLTPRLTFLTFLAPLSDFSPLCLNRCGRLHCQGNLYTAKACDPRRSFSLKF